MPQNLTDIQDPGVLFNTLRQPYRDVTASIVGAGFRSEGLSGGNPPTEQAWHYRLALSDRPCGSHELFVDFRAAELRFTCHLNPDRNDSPEALLNDQAFTEVVKRVLRSRRIFVDPVSDEIASKLLCAGDTKIPVRFSCNEGEFPVGLVIQQRPRVVGEYLTFFFPVSDHSYEDAFRERGAVATAVSLHQTWKVHEAGNAKYDTCTEIADLERSLRASLKIIEQHWERRGWLEKYAFALS